MQFRPLYLFLSILFVITFYSAVMAQLSYGSKTGGICFRVDDNQTAANWGAYAEAFDRYSLNFSFAVNLGTITDPAYIQAIKALQDKGNEMMDHSPNHSTIWFTAPRINDYKDAPGVDHVSGNTIYLAYDKIDTASSYVKKGSCNIDGVNAFSNSAGAFNCLGTSETYIGLYFPTLKSLYSVKNICASNINDIDTVTLTSLWGEDVSNPGKINNLPYIIVSQYDVKLSADAQKLLIKRTLDLCTAYGLQRPTTWIQPGARHPALSKEELKKNFSEFGYTAGAGLPSSAMKCFNEYDPNKDFRFGMQWSDFQEDFTDLTTLKKTISDGIAKHFVLFGHSHFINLLGGWKEYLSRMDLLLSWCSSKNIPVRTHSQWANELFNNVPNPFVNIFPEVNVDLNEDGIPDGYSGAPKMEGVTDNADGAPNVHKCSLRLDKKGTLCYISRLAGLEKGENEFSLWTKGAPGDSIEVTFLLTQINKSYSFKFPATTSQWKRYFLEQSASSNKTLKIPDWVSYMDIQITVSNYSGGTVKISGMSLRKKASSGIAPPWDLESSNAGKNIKLQWVDNSDDEKGFIVERKVDSTDTFKKFTELPENQNAFTDTAVEKGHQYYYRVRAYNDSLMSEYSNTTFKEAGWTSGNTKLAVIKDFQLLQNYPNPFNSSTNIIYYLPQNCRVNLAVYNTIGQIVTVLYDGVQKQGEHKFFWHSHVPSGVYLYRITALSEDNEQELFEQTKPLVVLK